MRFDPKRIVKAINKLHHETVERWHQVEPDNAYADFLGTVCQQHQYNFLLWHEEDVARSPDVSDARIASVKPAMGAKLNTETPGASIDRLSIMSLRIYHLEEQLERTDVDATHIERVQQRLARCRLQQADLSQSLAEHLFDLAAGRKALKVYRQMKMYNDATLNPYLYRAGKKQVA
jgi:hypothetical protein